PLLKVGQQLVDVRLGNRLQPAWRRLRLGGRSGWSLRPRLFAGTCHRRFYRKRTLFGDRRLRPESPRPRTGGDHDGGYTEKVCFQRRFRYRHSLQRLATLLADRILGVPAVRDLDYFLAECLVAP